MSPSRSYRGSGLPQRRRPLRLLVAFLVIVVLVDGLALGALVVRPDLASLIPGAAGEQLRSVADRGRRFAERLLSEDGPLGGIRRFAEPYLRPVGLNLSTVLLGIALLLLAAICIRILAVTSRPTGEEEETFVRAARGTAAEEQARSPYWPYDRRPSRTGTRPLAGVPPLDAPSRQFAPERLTVGPPMAPPPSDQLQGLPAGRDRVLFPAMATGDTGRAVEVSDQLAAGSDEATHDLLRPAAQVAPAPQENTISPEPPLALATSMPVSGDQGGVVAAPEPALYTGPEASPMPGMAAPGEVVAAVDRESGQSTVESPGRQERAYPPPEYPEAVPAEGYQSGRPVGEYLANMPAPPYLRTPTGGPAPVQRATDVRSAPEPRSAEVWIESRPGLGGGLRKFAVPGFLLLALGAGGAYGLQTPVASAIASSPYFTYILGGAAGLVSTLAAVWFAVGPMRPVVRRMQVNLSSEPGWGQSRDRSTMPVPGGAAREVAAAGTSPVVPARAELEAGLEPPDAADWRAVPKPSVFIPWSQTATAVGLDIGSAWIKLAQVSFGRRGLEIVNVGLCPTPEGVVTEGGVSDAGVLGEAIKSLVADRNILQRQVTAALGGQGVIIRHVEFPQMGEDELREVIRWEAEHHIPIPPTEAVVDFTIMPGQGGSDERNARQMRVMLVGAQRKIVEAYVDALKVAKLVPLGIDLEALAAYRVIQASGRLNQDPVRYAEAVVDLGHSSTKLSVYLRGALEMSRTLGAGGLAFTRVLAEGLQVSQVEAEALKRQYGLRAEGGRVLQVLAPTLQDLLFEIRRSFEFFASRHFGQTVRHVYLVGGGARMPGIAEAFGRYLNPSLDERIPEGADAKVEVIDPLSAASLVSKLDGHSSLIGPEFVTSLGLALGEESSYEG